MGISRDHDMNVYIDIAGVVVGCKSSIDRGRPSKNTSAPMAWWSRAKGVQTETDDKKSVPKGIWVKCDSCSEILYGPDLAETSRVCPKCEHHLALPTPERIELIVDDASFVEADSGVESSDPLEFRVDGKRYRDRLKVAKKTAGAGEAYLSGSARIGGYEVEIGFFVFEFMGGSMGSAVGEKICRQLE